MLIYEKNNKLNINFDNEVSEQPNVQIGKDEISLDGATINKDSVLPTPNVEEDVGKVPTVQEDGSYRLAEAGDGSSGGAFIVHVDNITNTLDKTWAEINAAIAKQPVILLFDHSDGISHYRKVCYIVQTLIVVNLTNTYDVYAIEHEFGVSDVSITKRVYRTTNENGYPRG